MADNKSKKEKGAETLPAPPVCCDRPMAINQRISRVSGARIVYRCTGKCGRTKTVKV